MIDIIYDILNKDTRANIWQGLLWSHASIEEVSDINNMKIKNSSRITVQQFSISCLFTSFDCKFRFRHVNQPIKALWIYGDLLNIFSCLFVFFILIVTSFCLSIFLCLPNCLFAVVYPCPPVKFLTTPCQLCTIIFESLFFFYHISHSSKLFP